jgi:murein DD-endopeptidase MepM/ murein hydrolase activator NlpD
MKLFKVILLLILTLTSSCSKPHGAEIVYKGNEFFGREKSFPNAKAYSTSKKTITEIIIQPGDTLLGIAKERRIRLSELARLNNMKTDAKLIAGKKLKVPSKGSEFPIKRRKTILEDENDEIARGQAPVIKEKNLSEPPRDKKPKAEVEVLETKKPAATTVVTEEEPEVKIVTSPESNFIWPVSGQVISKFGNKGSGKKNDGINIEAAEGADVKAVADGTVVYAGNELKGYGNLVIIKHANDILTAYGHQQKLSVTKGDKVKAGQVIGQVGDTGNVDSPQLHFAVRKAKKPVNPLSYLPKQ